ncbi:MAG TPA: hypothetical protein VJ225_01230 [Nitrososphaeraceae archaeon]|nr:hypothetical protein [Nitrososphaeraceae archaeon]
MEKRTDCSLMSSQVTSQGTSIGAMNGAILVSQYLETKSWDKASEELEKFWTDQLSLKSFDIGELNKPWYDEWVKKNPTVKKKSIY